MPKKKATTKPTVAKEAVAELETQLAIYQERIKALEDPKGKLTLVETPFTQNQILQVMQRTPKEHVHTRPGKGGGQWNYVTGVYVKKVLNFSFGWLWDFQILDKGFVEENGKIISVWSLGRLSIKYVKNTYDGKLMLELMKAGVDKIEASEICKKTEVETVVVKEQYGGAEIKYKKGSGIMDYANDLKTSATDALKKCASELGIASDIYGANEFKEINQELIEGKRTQALDTGDEAKKELLKLKNELHKMGAKNQKEALALLKEKTGMEWQDFNNKTAKMCKMAMANLLIKK